MSSQMLNDYKVEFRREETFAEVALSWRREARNENNSYFNVAAFVEDVLLSKTKLPFKIEFFNAREGEKPAYVKFNPRTLWVDREIWHLAKIGEPNARYIVAHEIGHLIFHHDDAKAFSNSAEDQIKFARPEYSAEWQAHTFAFYFLMPDLIVAAYNDAVELSAACGVTIDVARQRIAMSKRFLRQYNLQESGICPRCGGFTNNTGHCTDAACSVQIRRK
jgi:Zn-dependent peptidase ImmA (M78 family)